MTLRKRITKVAGWVVATVVPLIAAVVTQRRAIAVIASFAEWFLTRHSHAFLTAAIIIAILAVLRQVMARSVVDFLPLSFLLQRLPLLARVVLGAALVGACIIVLQYTMIQYRLFAEVTYPEAARKAWERKDVVAARETCEQYLTLYPQRAAWAGVPDTVCTPILESTVMLFNLRMYVARQRKLDSRHVEGITLGSAPELRQEILTVLDSEINGLNKQFQSPIPRPLVKPPRSLLPLVKLPRSPLPPQYKRAPRP